tara:strand:- start:3055 stop:4038 length:984 start_codon:yes stop_codon:yes gene_type:complete
MTYQALCVETVSKHPVLSDYEFLPLEKGQVRLKMLYAPINPADFNMMDAHYVIQPDCPFILGNEGVGVVDAVADDVDSSWLGKRVFFPFQMRHQWVGFWANYVSLPVQGCIVVPDFMDDQQAAMISINPLTAWVILADCMDLNAGDWIIQNAANSALGRWFIYIANQLGIHTVNIVRNDAMIEPLKLLGADSVIVYDDHFSKQVPQKGSFKLALNGVGGHSAKELSKCLDYGGILMTYGAMSKEAVCIGNVALIYKCIIATGFNRSLWAESVSIDHVKTIYKRLFEMLQHSSFLIPVKQVFCLDDYTDALGMAQQASLGGKVLFRLS